MYVIWQIHRTWWLFSSSLYFSSPIKNPISAQKHKTHVFSSKTSIFIQFYEYPNPILPPCSWNANNLEHSDIIYCILCIVLNEQKKNSHSYFLLRQFYHSVMFSIFQSFLKSLDDLQVFFKSHAFSH